MAGAFFAAVFFAGAFFAAVFLVAAFLVAAFLVALTRLVTVLVVDLAAERTVFFAVALRVVDFAAGADLAHCGHGGGPRRPCDKLR